MNNAFGEIVASSLTQWTITCWQLETYPPFGALISALSPENGSYFGVIAGLETKPTDSHRTPFAFGKTREELEHEQPHIFTLMQSTVEALPLAYSSGTTLIYEIPKKPLMLHTFVQPATVPQVQRFFKDPTWLITFFNGASGHPLFDELLIALLRQAGSLGALHKENMAELVDIFSLLTHADYKKLKIFLQRIEPFIQKDHV